ncbi:MAG: hypothetical protein NZ959_05275 [Armatimonadetes bacterium]|nr:hypothetical protein [Armatimonadota bacterium]MDW8122253.1 hypothetical protein [Armatimonadota bacterium]
MVSGKVRLCLWLVGLFIAVVGQSTNVVGQTPQDDPIILSVDFDNASVGDVLNLIFTETQISYVASPDILNLSVGRLRLHNMPVSQIIRYLCDLTGIQARRDEKGVYILSRSQPAPPASPTPKKPPEEPEEVKEEKMIPQPPKVVSPDEWATRALPADFEVLKIRYLPVTEVCHILGIPVLGDSSYRGAYELLQRVRNQVTNMQTGGYSGVPLMNPSVSGGMSPVSSSSLISGIGVPGLGATVLDSGFLRSPDVARAGIGGIGGVGGGFGPGGLVGGGPGGLAGPGVGGGFGGVPGGVGGVGGILGLIPGLQQIIGIPTQNAILVYGTAEAIDQLREILFLIDQPPDQVEIESQFVAVVGSLSEILGIDWRMAGSEVTVVTQGMPLGTLTQIGYVRGNLQAVLGTAISSNRGKVINAPRAFTINGLPAIFTSVIFRPVIIQTAITDLAGNVRTITNIIAVPLVTGLFAVPFINEDDTVTMSITPIVTDILGEFPNPAGGTIPIFNVTTTFALVRVRDGESFAIGGLLTSRDSSTQREVPLLARLPLIGSLFRGKDRTISEQNLIVFVTPRIIRLEEGTFGG